MRRTALIVIALSAVLLPPVLAQKLPTSWVDKDAGHRVIRLTNEPGSSGFYFNVNAFTLDGKQMVYNMPDGIHALDLASMKRRLVVPNPPPSGDAVPGSSASLLAGVHTIVVGRKTNSVFFSKMDPTTKLSTRYKADVYTGEVTKLVALPPRASVATINADEALGVGSYDENEADSDREYGRNLPRPATSAPGAINEPNFWQPGVFHSEHLVNMSHHNYRLEPNVRFSPDQKLVFFTSNMFGASYVFAVEVAKADNPGAEEIHSTPELASQYAAAKPGPTHQVR
jgi:hypothetical protein